MNSAPRGWRVALAAAGVAAVALGVYVWTLAPTVTGEDSGELIAASWCMGVPHPPGYPLWTVCSKLWSVAFPFGEIAWRVNLFSAACAAASVYLLVYIALESGLSLAGSLAAALICAFSQTFWSQSIIAEVYTIGILTVFLSIYAMIRYENTGRTGYAYAAALAYGFTMAAHQMALILAPVIVIFVLTAHRRRMLKPLRLGLAIFLSLLPLVIWLWLMFRARTDTPVNWGEPYNLQRLWAHISRSQYPSELTKFPRGVGISLRRMGALLDIALRQFSPVLAVLLPAGIHALRRSVSRRLFWMYGTVALVGSVGVVELFNPSLEREIMHTVDVFLLYAWAIAALALGASVDLTRRLLQSWKPFSALPRRAVTAAVALTMVAVPLVANWDVVSMRGNYLAHDYAVNMLECLPENSVVMPGGDHNTFPLIYLAAVEKRRPDVTIGDKYGYVEHSLYKDMPKSFPDIPTTDQRKEILAWLLEHDPRPMYFSTPPNLPGIRTRQEGLLYRAIRPEDLPPVEDPLSVWDRFKWRNIVGEELTLKTSDYSSQMIMSDYCAMRANALLDAGDMEAGERLLGEAARYGWGVKELLNNLASMAAEKGLTGLAESLFISAIEVEPSYETAHRNLQTLRRSAEERRRQGAFGAPQVPDMFLPPDPFADFLPDVPELPGPVPGGPALPGEEGF